jgi:cytochrome P450
MAFAAPRGSPRSPAEIGSAAVGVFGAEGEAWKRQRRMVMAGFDPRHLRAYFPSLVKVSERLAGRWQRAADAGAPIDLQGDLMRYTVDTVSGLAFGAEVNTLESDDDVIQRHLDKIFPAIFRRIMAALPDLALVEVGRRPRARRKRRRDQPCHPGVRRRRAQAPRGSPRARRAGEPARGDDRRGRRPAVGNHAGRDPRQTC